MCTALDSAAFGLHYPHLETASASTTDEQEERLLQQRPPATVVLGF